MKLFLEISSIGSACGKNRYEPINRTLLNGVIRHSPKLAKNYLLQMGYVAEVDSNKKNRDAVIFSAYSEATSGVNNPNQFEKMETETIKKIKKSVPDFSEKDLERAKTFVKESIKKDCGTNVEKEVITEKDYSPGNKKMYYYSVGNSVIGGLHDATSSDGMVIEIKTRMSSQNVRKNEYDLYQLIGYLLAMGIKKGKIVQKFGSKVFDSDIETEIEYGIVDLNDEKWKTVSENMKSNLSEYFTNLGIIIETNDTDTLGEVFPRGDTPIAKINNSGKLIDINYKYQKFLKCFS